MSSRNLPVDGLGAGSSLQPQTPNSPQQHYLDGLAVLRCHQAGEVDAGGDFSGGDLADDGIHQLDLVMMLLGNPGLPAAVSCSGGWLHHRDDDSEVPERV